MHSRAREGMRRLGDAAHMALDEGREVCQRQEFPMGANASRRTCPDGVQNFMKKRAAFEGGEAGFGGLPRLRAETSGGEGLEGALRLRGENAGPARYAACREGKLARVLKG